MNSDWLQHSVYTHTHTPTYIHTYKYLGRYSECIIGFTESNNKKNQNKYVLRLHLTVSTELAVLMAKGKEFQAFAAATVKLRSPMTRFDLGTTKWFVSIAHRKGHKQ